MDMTRQLSVIVKKMGINFTLKGSPIAPNEVFADTGLLPGICRRADQLASLCFGYGLGTTYEDAEKSLLGSKVIFDDFTPDVLRLFCIVDVLYEIARNSVDKQMVALDELMYD